MDLIIKSIIPSYEKCCRHGLEDVALAHISYGIFGSSKNARKKRKTASANCTIQSQAQAQSQVSRCRDRTARRAPNRPSCENSADPSLRKPLIMSDDGYGGGGDYDYDQGGCVAYLLVFD